MSNRDGNEIFEVEEIEESSYAEVDKKDLKRVKKYKIKVEEFLLDKHIIVIVCLVFIIVIEFLLINNKSKLLRMIFLNKDNEFQWLAGTAIAAILTFLFTSINTVKKNKADLVAKSRIEWIKEVKRIMSIFLTDVHYYPFLYEKLQNITVEHSKYDELEKEVNELTLKIEENQNLLLLHLSDNDDNKQINDCITACGKWIMDMPNRWNILTSGGFVPGAFDYENTPIENLLLVSRDYFKREWNKSKTGK